MKLLLVGSVILFCLKPEIVSADPPAWAKTNTQKLAGSNLTVVCSGTGPSTDLARKDALESCRNSARQQLVSDIHVKTLTVQTETNAGFHEEVTENIDYTGLKCIPERDQVDEANDSVKVWVQCRFDLKQVKAIPSAQTGPVDNGPVNSADGIKNKAELNAVNSNDNKNSPGRFISSTTTLSIASVPACASLLVRGNKPRKIDCDQNPMTITLENNDREIIVRANGYQPKTMQLGNQRESHESVQVILDPL